MTIAAIITSTTIAIISSALNALTIDAMCMSSPAYERLALTSIRTNYRRSASSILVSLNQTIDGLVLA
jgi:hypothetical protein